MSLSLTIVPDGCDTEYISEEPMKKGAYLNLSQVSVNIYNLMPHPYQFNLD